MMHRTTAHDSRRNPTLIYNIRYCAQSLCRIDLVNVNNNLHCNTYS